MDKLKDKQHDKQHDKLYVIGVFAKLTGVTERTLRFYDRKGLLKPSARNEHGHRFYSERDIYQLQKIMVLKYLDFSLEEIEQYLQRHEEDFRLTLDSQYELLLRKQKQLERVIGTIERMQYLLQDAGSVDINLLLLLIHSLQHEESQKVWLQSQLPSSLVNVIFMEDKTADERLDIERQMIACMTEIKGLYKEGRTPTDPEVVEAASRLAAVYEMLLGPALKTLSPEELALFEKLEDGLNELDPMLFPNIFTPEEEFFFKQTFAHIEELGNSEGNGDHNGEA